MKRWIVLIIILLVMVSQRQEDHSSSVEDKKRPEVIKTQLPTRPVSNYIPKKYPPVPAKDRTPAALKAVETKPSRALSSLSKPGHIKVGKSFEVLTGVYGLKKELFKPHMGHKVSEDQHFIYYQSDVMVPEAYPVALNSGSQKIYPLSPILHVKGADEVLRAQLKAEGMSEFYYHPRMKLLSVQSSPSLVLSQYQALLKRGLDVRLEVLKEVPKSK